MTWCSSTTYRTTTRRVEFNRLHVWSTRLESAVLLLGLAVIFLTSRRIS